MLILDSLNFIAYFQKMSNYIPNPKEDKNAMVAFLVLIIILIILLL